MLYASFQQSRCLQPFEHRRRISDRPFIVSLTMQKPVYLFVTDVGFLLTCCVFLLQVSDADSSEGSFQLKKEHALRVLGYISSWTQRSVLLPLQTKPRNARILVNKWFKPAADTLQKMKMNFTLKC